MTDKPDTRLRRLPERGSSDFASACSIIDEARIGHVGFCLDHFPYVVPMAVGRAGQDLLLHGSIASRAMKHLAAGNPCCVTITHLDGMVLARSAFNSSMNYRALMIFGEVRAVTDPGEKQRSLDVLVEHLLPGRLSDLRPPTRKELNATMLLALPIETFSIKHRSGPPGDAKADLDAPIWAGVVPLGYASGAPQPAPDLARGVELPPYLHSD